MNPINKNNMTIPVPEKAGRILDRLHGAGYEAYVVGGCVRDMLLGRMPSDWDITTNALPEEVKGLFARTFDTGIEHGTVTVLCGKEGFEVTTYRIDGDYADHRHPQNVTFSRSLREDLARRDFTMNAMAYNAEEGLIDPFQGLRDMRDGIIRCVGASERRFGEDALRILRAYRFSAQLGYRPDEEVRAAARLLAPTLAHISAERIRTELVKLIVSDHPEVLVQMYEDGITAHFLPEFDICMETPQNNPYHCYTVGMHTVVSMQAVEKDPLLRLTMLLHDIGKPATRTTDADGTDHFFNHPAVGAEMAKKVLQRLRFDNRTIARTRNLIRYHDIGIGGKLSKKNVRRAVHLVGKDDYPLLLKVKAADNAAKSGYRREEKAALLQQEEALYREIIASEEALSIGDLKINGRDLIAEGIAEGKEIGSLLKQLLEEVLEDPARNTRETLLARVRALRAPGETE